MAAVDMGGAKGKTGAPGKQEEHPGQHKGLGKPNPGQHKGTTKKAGKLRAKPKATFDHPPMTPVPDAKKPGLPATNPMPGKFINVPNPNGMGAFGGKWKTLPTKPRQ